MKRCPLTAPVYQAVSKALMEPASYSIAEIGPLVPRKAVSVGKGKRLNLLVPITGQLFFDAEKLTLH